MALLKPIKPTSPTPEPEEVFGLFPEEVGEALQDLSKTLCDNEKMFGVTLILTQDDQTRTYHFSNAEDQLVPYIVDVQSRAFEQVANEILERVTYPAPVFLGQTGEA